MTIEAFDEATRALAAGDSSTAWQAVRPIMSYPDGVALSDADWVRGLDLVERIGDSPTDDMVAALRAGRSSPADIEALYHVGYQLIEARLPLVAATALARANALAPDVPAVVNELSSALETDGLYRDAYEMLAAASGARRENWMSRYLHAFNAMMSGHVAAARGSLAELGAPSGETEEVMRRRLQAFVARHDRLVPSSPLDDRDLRGWHHVITSGVLTHRSPHGFDDGMNGRYAYVQDSESLVREGIIRAKTVLRVWGVQPPRLYHSDDRSSEILALAWQQHTGIPAEPFLAGHENEPGLFIAYDLFGADLVFLRANVHRRPGQLLVTHATCWTEDYPFTGDITTFLYQHNVAPWEAGRIRLDPETDAAERLSADDAPASELATAILTAEMDDDAMADLDDLASFAAACGPPAEGQQRDRLFQGSPVPSSRFL